MIKDEKIKLGYVRKGLYFTCKEKVVCLARAALFAPNALMKTEFELRKLNR